MTTDRKPRISGAELRLIEQIGLGENAPNAGRLVRRFRRGVEQILGPPLPLEVEPHVVVDLKARPPRPDRRTPSWTPSTPAISWRAAFAASTGSRRRSARYPSSAGWSARETGQVIGLDPTGIVQIERQAIRPMEQLIAPRPGRIGRA